ncbi:phosphoribosylformylglycinamidine synthase isoform X1 [Halyomorpha halys]|uniref:phosphoribosylformylglycinamidine synthase isoform X1 n=2 Tax=Halyomorpha halys TaxID=286706 RepID=UPI0006D4F96F|nr:phosphoribosylformylglycinamidine synthase isoform X1 [Halyomorpha halys]
MMEVVHFYRTPGLSEGQKAAKLKEIQEITSEVIDLSSEICFNLSVHHPLDSNEIKKLLWLLSCPLNPESTREEPFLYSCPGKSLIEIGPRLNFSTAFSSNAVSICHSMGLKNVTRLEVSIRYLVHWSNEMNLSDSVLEQTTSLLHDRMTECQYYEPIKSFNHGIIPENWAEVDIINGGRKALEELNTKLGLAFDDWDLDFYYCLFKNKLKRNPTSVECFDLAQSNSEHSRHWFFKGEMVINGETQSKSLIDMIIETQRFSNPNNIIKFSDNSSAIYGFEIKKLLPSQVHQPSAFETSLAFNHLTFTAETHNFPTGVSPFSGATTGTGGRIRDVQAVGRGGYCIAGTAGYAVGNLLIPGYEQPWENSKYIYPNNVEKPLKILIEASNGASDYGNKFGEPLIAGFTRSFGLEDLFDERREWIKPIMFSGGIGVMDADQVTKMTPEKGMKVVKVGGPVYRIGVGGGSASSVQVHGDNRCELDFNAVQRGDAEMENKMNRIIRACLEAGKNPICSIHDQGAGGNGNVLKELVEPMGAVVFCKAFTLGDDSISTLELWGAEYQESNAILLKPEDEKMLLKLSHRERCPIDIVGVVTGTGKVILSEEEEINTEKYLNNDISSSVSYPFNLDLELVLGKMPRKKFLLEDRSPNYLHHLFISPETTVLQALNNVLRLVTVCSKRFLTNKVDRCVTGLIAQQQCVGPLHVPLSDCAVTAISMFNKEGIASSIGEQPLKGLVNPSAGARMTVAEALTNLMFAKISSLQDVKCSGNWMWAAKLPGEGAALFRTCQAMCDFMSQLGIAVDGGKDSLSMAARVNETTVKSPGTLVISTYAPCPDVRVVITPDIKSPSEGNVGSLIWVSLSDEHRLGGSAFAQCSSQIGSCVPDVENPLLLKEAFEITQILISEGKIKAGHDISDGGLITCVLEMAFGGLSGLDVKIDMKPSPIEVLFAEEVGWIIEVHEDDVEYIMDKYKSCAIKSVYIGRATGFGMDSMVTFRNSEDKVILANKLYTFYQMWEETSYQLECKQSNIECVTEEFLNLRDRSGPKFCVSFNPDEHLIPRVVLTSPPRVAVIREEGTNGDREMAAALYMASFETWDVTMQDLFDKKVTTDTFHGIVFPGGFSYADVLGSAKGWAACLLFSEFLRAQFTAFKNRPDTFSLGVCNGCQLMSLLGWIGSDRNDIDVRSLIKKPSVFLAPNLSDRYECRFVNVKFEKSPALMCRNMEGSMFGVWIAHGEGRFTFDSNQTLKYIEDHNCVSFRYVDDEGHPTENYPLNPNGSKGGIAGICSEDGRHLAMMPHPERCVLMWQWPYVPPNFRKFQTSPWLTFFKNAYIWVNENC